MSFIWLNTLTDLHVREVPLSMRPSRGYGTGTTIQKERRVRELPGEKDQRRGLAS